MISHDSVSSEISLLEENIGKLRLPGIVKNNRSDMFRVHSINEEKGIRTLDAKHALEFFEVPFADDLAGARFVASLQRTVRSDINPVFHPVISNRASLESGQIQDMRL